MSYFIFKAGPVELCDQSYLPSVKVIRHRLKICRWPLYSGTHNANKINEGDSCVFYAAGYHTSAQCFVGKATVKKVIQNTSGQKENRNWVVDVPNLFVELDNVELFSQTVPIKARLDQLSFIKNPKAWGISMQGGVKQVSEIDFTSCLPCK